LLDDLTLVAALPVRFLPAVVEPERLPEPAPSAECGPLCVRLSRHPEGARLCRIFRQKLRDAAEAEPQGARCDAGLWEIAVPVRVGAQTVGHLLVSGCAGEPTDAPDGRARHLLARAGVEIEPAVLATLRAPHPVVPKPRREALTRVLQLGADRLALLLTEHLVTAPTELPELVDQACRIVHAEYRDSLRLEALTRRLGVSEGHFSRTFHHATGLRFVDYVARYRAERARMLLLEAVEVPVSEVATACGFCSVSQFNRVFRAVYDTTPRAMRASRRR
jgi:AraC-like DNA-binding protein